MRLIVFLMFFFFANSSHAFVAMIWDCKVTVPDSYMVDTRSGDNQQSVSFKKHNFLDPSGGMFKVRQNEIGVKQLESLKESEKGNLRFLGEHREGGFLISAYELPSLNTKFNIVTGKKQQVIFYGDAVELWPSMIKGCDGKYSHSEVRKNDAVFEKISKFLRGNATLSIVRENGSAIGLRLYNPSEYLVKKGVENGDVVVKICNASIEGYLSAEVSCKSDNRDFLVQNKSGKLIKIDFPN